MSWTPHSVVTDELIDPSPVAALAALFDDGLPTPGPGDELPPLWHWVALPRWAASADLSVDGHPFRGSFLPPVELPRRMFAGGYVEFRRALCIGDVTRRESQVVDVTEKTGRSGPLVLVTVVTTLHDHGGEPAVIETQNLVYREAAAPTAAAAAPADQRPVGPPLRSVGDDWEFRTDPTLLMRFSAATANAHRIHYDWPYATGVEGYPGLVVHGPLMSLAIAEAHRLSGGPQVTRLRHRNSAPLFCGANARIVSDGFAASLLGPDGEPRVVATITSD